MAKTEKVRIKDLLNEYVTLNDDDYILVDGNSLTYKLKISKMKEILHLTQVSSVDYSENGNESNLLPWGCMLERIIIKPHASNSVTNLKIGITDGGTEILPEINISSDNEQKPITISPQEECFSFNAYKTVYIQASNWSSATLRIYFLYKVVINEN